MARKYRLIISGEVKYEDCDKKIEDLLLGVKLGPQADVAIQELEEQAENINIQMIPIQEDKE